MDTTEFRTILQKEGNFTFISIPFSPAGTWGARPRYYVAGTINDHPVRGCLGALKQDYFLRVGAAWLRDSGIKIGDEVTVKLSLEGPQEDNLAEDILRAVSANQQAKEFFDSLPTFYRKNYIRWIESANREDTRSKRIDEMIQLLAQGKRER